MSEIDIQSVKQRFGIIGRSDVMDRALAVALRVASTSLSVLVTGESGVGKEFFPQIIHAYSSRKHNKYIAVNCGAIPEGTIDSELFGHEKGSFTGATEARKGYFEEANGGTIFLDEVGELPLSTQVRLLRVLQSGEYMRVGSATVQKTVVRVVAATNNDLTKSIESGRFREDLYYRLNTVPISVPALRERKEDIPLLFRKFAADVSVQYGMPPVRLTEDARQMLMNYYWRGNIRQLKNVTERISALEQDPPRCPTCPSPPSISTISLRICVANLRISNSFCGVNAISSFTCYGLFMLVCYHMYYNLSMKLLTMEHNAV
jgi:transcriptional regulator with PAS, ATPase and Fis domain